MLQNIFSLQQTMRNWSQWCCSVLRSLRTQINLQCALRLRLSLLSLFSVEKTSHSKSPGSAQEQPNTNQSDEFNEDEGFLSKLKKKIFG